MTPSKRLALGLTALALAGVALYYAAFREKPAGIAPTREFTLGEGKAYFVENEHLGRLYVVEGRLTNDLGSVRCRIQIKASLLDASGRKLAQGQAVAGLTASISELKFLGWEEIQARLEPPATEPCRATAVQPGGKAAFMIVFRDPPPEAATYSLVAVGSQVPGANP